MDTGFLCFFALLLSLFRYKLENIGDETDDKSETNLGKAAASDDEEVR